MSDAQSRRAAPAVENLLRSHRFRFAEALPWLIAVLAFFAFPDYRALGSQILINILFAISLDLILGYAGIVTLGHAAFFGVGAYTAGLLAAHGWGEPISGVLAGAAVAAVTGLASGAVILRTRALTLLMLTLMIVVMLQEGANKAGGVTGGADGLQGMEMWPVLGLFHFDLYYQTAYLYCLAALFLCWTVVRRIVHSPFGRALTGIRENEARMHAIGSPVFRRRLTAYTIAATLAGVAGALLAQTTQFVALEVLSFERSGAVLIMLILGGVGRLYGAFIGVPLFMILQDRFQQSDPVYWDFWIGVLLIVVVVFVRGGALVLFDRLALRAGARR